MSNQILYGLKFFFFLAKVAKQNLDHFQLISGNNSMQSANHSMHKLFCSKRNVKQLILIATELFSDITSQQTSRFRSIFTSNWPPSISIAKLLTKLCKQTRFTAESLLLTIIYIDRYIVAIQHFELCKRNIYKLVLAALLLASKFQEDFSKGVRYFERVTGINRLHLQQLESQLLMGLNYNLYVPIEDCVKLETQLYQVYGRKLKA